jgi:riboflavin-specific deaminase-like protein
MKIKLPFVFSNFAMTADGKIAFTSSEFKPFSSRHDREHMMELRAQANAVICGARTVEVTGTILGNGGNKFRKMRINRGLTEFPLRVLVSGSGSINQRSAIFKKRFSPIIILTTRRASERKLQELRTLADEVRICGDNEINFRAALQWLREKCGVRRLLCEGGGELHDALIRAGLVDELHLTICPKIFGGRNAPTISDGIGFRRLTEAMPLQIKSFEQISDEIFAVIACRNSLK